MSTDKTLLQSILKAGVNNLQRQGEDFAFDQIETTLGLVFGAGLRVAMGPIGFVLPMEKITVWGIKVLYTGLKDWQNERRKTVGTAYNIHTTRSGLLVAENTNPSGLHKLPVPLPKVARYPLASLVGKQPEQAAALKEIDGNLVFRSLWDISHDETCRVCGQAIAKYGSLELGHALGCPSNKRLKPRRVSRVIRRYSVPTSSRNQRITSGRACVICGQSGNHAPDCFLNPLTQNWASNLPTPKSIATHPVRVARQRIVSPVSQSTAARKNIVRTAAGKYKPAAGYTWSDKRHLEAVWTPGKEHPDHPNVIASETEGEWHPKAGYEWRTGGESDLRVAWSPGSKDPDHPHVVASKTKDIWKPAAGYEWVTKEDGDLRVKRTRRRTSR